MKRHVKEFHNADSTSTDVEDEEHVCPESGCGKTFKYPSKLQKHEDSHAYCSEPGCTKYFSNKQCLEAHIRFCHQYITCEICGTRQLSKNIKWHLRSREERGSSERVKCMLKGCLHSFANKSNFQEYVKAVHHEMRSFACGIPSCRMRFAYKHVRDNHEKSGCHTYVLGDFTEADEQFNSRPRGGRKRKCPTVEMLMRKRVSTAASTESCNMDGVLVS